MRPISDSNNRQELNINMKQRQTDYIYQGSPTSSALSPTIYPPYPSVQNHDSDSPQTSGSSPHTPRNNLPSLQFVTNLQKLADNGNYAVNANQGANNNNQNYNNNINNNIIGRNFVDAQINNRKILNCPQGNPQAMKSERVLLSPSEPIHARTPRDWRVSTERSTNSTSVAQLKNLPPQNGFSHISSSSLQQLPQNHQQQQEHSQQRPQLGRTNSIPMESPTAEGFNKMLLRTPQQQIQQQQRNGDNRVSVKLEFDETPRSQPQYHQQQNISHGQQYQHPQQFQNYLTFTPSQEPTTATSQPATPYDEFQPSKQSYLSSLLTDDGSMNTYPSHDYNNVEGNTQRTDTTRISPPSTVTNNQYQNFDNGYFANQSGSENMADIRAAHLLTTAAQIYQQQQSLRYGSQGADNGFSTDGSGLEFTSSIDNSNDEFLPGDSLVDESNGTAGPPEWQRQGLVLRHARQFSKLENANSPTSTSVSPKRSPTSLNSQLSDPGLAYLKQGSKLNNNYSNEPCPLESYFGFIESDRDAVIVILAARAGILKSVLSRPNKSDKSLIRSGTVCVFSGVQNPLIARWTDGKLWTPSRVSGYFLKYYQCSAKLSAEYNRQLRAQDTKSVMVNGMKAICNAKGGYIQRNDTYALVKKTTSVCIDGETWHLISYYSKSDIDKIKSCDKTDYFLPRPRKDDSLVDRLRRIWNGEIPSLANIRTNASVGATSAGTPTGESELSGYSPMFTSPITSAYYKPSANQAISSRGSPHGSDCESLNSLLLNDESGTSQLTPIKNIAQLSPSNDYQNMVSGQFANEPVLTPVTPTTRQVWVGRNSVDITNNIPPLPVSISERSSSNVSRTDSGSSSLATRNTSFTHVSLLPQRISDEQSRRASFDAATFGNQPLGTPMVENVNSFSANDTRGNYGGGNPLMVHSTPASIGDDSPSFRNQGDYFNMVPGYSSGSSTTIHPQSTPLAGHVPNSNQQQQRISFQQAITQNLVDQKIQPRLHFPSPTDVVPQIDGTQSQYQPQQQQQATNYSFNGNTTVKTESDLYDKQQ